MRRGNAVIAIIVGALVLIVFMFTLVYYAVFGRLPTIDKPTGSGVVIVSNSCVTPILPTIKDAKKFADAIDKYIAKYNSSKTSPFQGLGSEFVKAGAESGVNPAWVINIARKESTFGTQGWAVKNANNAFGRTASSSQPSATSPNGRNWYKYDSFQASIGLQSAYLKSRYIDKGLTTFETITAVYAPPSENNTNTYISEMKQWVGEVVGMAGDGLQCQDAGSSSPTTTTK